MNCKKLKPGSYVCFKETVNLDLYKGLVLNGSPEVMAILLTDCSSGLWERGEIYYISDHEMHHFRFETLYVP